MNEAELQNIAGSEGQQISSKSKYKAGPKWQNNYFHALEIYQRHTIIWEVFLFEKLQIFKD